MDDQPAWVARVLGILLWLALLAVWIAWWLGAVSWQKAWPALSQGAWLGVVLGVLMGALVWSEIDPTPMHITDLGTIPSFWARLGCVAGLAALALFCGWLQGVLRWMPPEIEVEPPEGHAGSGRDAHHGHGH
jgi:hypothetical protein